MRKVLMLLEKRGVEEITEAEVKSEGIDFIVPPYSIGTSFRVQMR